MRTLQDMRKKEEIFSAVFIEGREIVENPAYPYFTCIGFSNKGVFSVEKRLIKMGKTASFFVFFISHIPFEKKKEAK